MGHSTVPLTYTFGSGHTGTGQGYTVVRGVCYYCRKTEEISWPRNNNPAGIQRAFENHGWDFDAFSPRKCRCPACKSATRSHDPNELIRKTEAKMQRIPPAPNKSLTAAAAALAVVPKTAPDDAVDAVRDPNMKEMRAIMAMLDERFDDKAGAYCKGWDDRAVAEALELPMAMITKVRREAFGEIKLPREIEELQREIREQFERLVALEAKVNALAAKHQR